MERVRNYNEYRIIHYAEGIVIKQYTNLEALYGKSCRYDLLNFITPETVKEISPIIRTFIDFIEPKYSIHSIQCYKG
jgi:hypothetical protein